MVFQPHVILQSKHVLLGVDETMVGRHQTHAYGVLCENMLITSRVFFTDIIMETDYQNLQGKNKGILHLICFEESCHSILSFAFGRNNKADL